MDRKKKKSKKKEKDLITDKCCYQVVDACGCAVGTLCCDSEDASNCSFYRCA